MLAITFPSTSLTVSYIHREQKFKPGADAYPTETHRKPHGTQSCVKRTLGLTSDKSALVSVRVSGEYRTCYAISSLMDHCTSPSTTVAPGHLLTRCTDGMSSINLPTCEDVRLSSSTSGAFAKHFTLDPAWKFPSRRLSFRWHA